MPDAEFAAFGIVPVQYHAVRDGGEQFPFPFGVFLVQNGYLQVVITHVHDRLRLDGASGELHAHRMEVARYDANVGDGFGDRRGDGGRHGSYLRLEREAVVAAVGGEREGGFDERSAEHVPFGVNPILLCRLLGPVRQAGYPGVHVGEGDDAGYGGPFRYLLVADVDAAGVDDGKINADGDTLYRCVEHLPECRRLELVAVLVAVYLYAPHADRVGVQHVVTGEIGKADT